MAGWHVQINTNPTYGIGINKSFADVINDHGLQQFINVPSRGNNVLHLSFCSNPCI